MNQGNRTVQQPSPAPERGAESPRSPGSGRKPAKFTSGKNLTKIGYIAFIALVTLLILAILYSVIFTKKSGTGESSNIDRTKYQAVFLNGGQVYFGKIDDLNSQYLSLNNIYYLRVNQQVQPNQQNTNANDVSLVKLGCELHGPQDSMVINREQVIFWENLKDDGQVAKAVAEYQKSNPEGQNCDQQQNTTNNSGNTTTQTPSTTNTTNKPTTTTPTTGR